MVKRIANLKLYSLLISLTFVLSFFAFLFLYDFGFERVISLAFIIGSFLLFIISLIMVNMDHKASLSVAILCSISEGLLLSFSSRLLNDVLKYTYRGDTLFLNEWSFAFIMISSGIVLSVFVSEIFYFLNIFSMKHFYFKYLLEILTLLILGSVFILTILKNIEGFEILPNLMSYSFIVVFFSFFLTYYKEETRKLIDDGINPKFDVKIALAPITITIYAIPECMNLLLNSTKNR